MNRSGHKIERYGIQFDSLLELDIYEEFLSRGIELERGEPIKIINASSSPIFCYSNDNKKFELKKDTSSIRRIEYTPDFTLKVHFIAKEKNGGKSLEGDFNVYIEAKGFANETFRYRWKLFKQWIVEHDPTARIFLIKRRHNGRVNIKDNQARLNETKEIVDNILNIIYDKN